MAAWCSTRIAATARFRRGTPAHGARIDPASLRAIGVTPARGRAILAMAGAVAGGRLGLEPGGDVEGAMADLKTLPGLGE